MCRVIALARSSRRVIWLPVCLGLVMGVGGYSATRGAVAFGDLRDCTNCGAVAISGTARSAGCSTRTAGTASRTRGGAAAVAYPFLAARTPSAGGWG